MGDKLTDKPTVADDLIGGMKELADALESGADIRERFRVSRLRVVARCVICGQGVPAYIEGAMACPQCGGRLVDLRTIPPEYQI